MKEYIETITDSFTDYKGEVHHFVIAAISQTLPKYASELKNCPIGHEDDEVTYEIEIYVAEYGSYDYMTPLSKALKIGIAICNPTDKFDEEVGRLKAIARARNSNPVMYVTDQGIINTKMVKALLEQEANYLKNNPEKYIQGYADTKKRYEARIEMENMRKQFSPIETQITESLQRDPAFLDKVMKYIDWSKKQC